MKKVVVFGSNGMLGRYVCKVAEANSNVVPVTRADINVANYNEYNKLDVLLEDADLVVNCAGVVKPQVSKMSPSEVYMVNSIFPRYLSQKIYHDPKCIMVHITTDCVYDGMLPFPERYCESSVAMPDDIYGQSKLWGEGESGWTGRCEMCIIRTSIIGEEVGASRSLLEWAKSNKNKDVNGFTNHFWNGLTCLELAKYINDNFIADNSDWTGVKHVFSECVNKFQLLSMINEAFDLNMTINAVEAAHYCNRCLDSNRSGNTFIKKSLSDQLRELAEFHDTLYT